MATLFAVGDLHGDVAQAHAVLRLLGLIDEDRSWAGGNATLVQTGDLVDRGPESLPLMRYFQALQPQARAAGGRVVTLMGNHEALNVEGDLRYVDANELAAAGGSAAWSALFAPDGEMGRAIGAYDVAVVAGDGPCRTLFVHAGLRPELLAAEGSRLSDGGLSGGGLSDGDGLAQLEALNRRARAQLLVHPHTGLLGSSGPIWYRGYAQRSEAEVCAALWRTLQAVGAHRMVSGHTIVPSHRSVLTRCGGAYHMIDVGMSRAYHGSLAGWSCALSPGTSQDPNPDP